MSNKTNLIIGVLVVAAAVGLVIVQSSGKKPAPPAQSQQTEQTTQETQATQTNTTQQSTNATAPAAKTYTLADVAAHASASDCWTTIDGGVYDVTSWIGKHPGGAEAIIGLCGVDGSAAFDGQHGGERRPANELASFKIGTLAR